MAVHSVQYSEPRVTREKYDLELHEFKRIRSEWREKGVFLIHEEFPYLEFIFSLSKLKPPSIVFSVRLDFTNYDLEPISIKFIDPFNSSLLKRKDVPINFWQVKIADNLPPSLPQELRVQKQDLLQGGPETIPFFCVPGVKEYHDHPFHTGDSWLLYRSTGIGTLHHILDQLYNHSIISIKGHNVTLTPSIVGYSQDFQIPTK